MAGVCSTGYSACFSLKLHPEFTNGRNTSLIDLIKIDRENLPIKFASALDINGCSLLACYLEPNSKRNKINQRKIVFSNIQK